jgi:uncharacterized protein with HEPN domain
MAHRPQAPRLTDMIEAIERVLHVTEDLSLEGFEADWEKQWLVQRGVEIISEASRHLSDELQLRYPEIPWRKVAGVGNVLRHEYGDIAAPVLWGIVREQLPALGKVCREELAVEGGQERSDGSTA